MDPEELWQEVTPLSNDECSDTDNDTDPNTKSKTPKSKSSGGGNTAGKKKRKRDVSPAMQVPLISDSNQVCSKNCKVCDLTDEEAGSSEFKKYFDSLYDNSKLDSVMCTKKIMKRFEKKHKLNEMDEADIMIHFNLSKTKFENNVYRNMVRMINSSKITPSQLLQYFQFAKEEYSKVDNSNKTFWS